MERWCFAPILVCVLIRGVVGEEMSEMEGKSFTLHTNVAKQKHDTMLWYFNGICIAMINGNGNSSCLYYGESERFRDKLDILDHDSGSLTITHITSEHAGLYEAQIIIRENKGKTISIDGAPKCNPTKIIRKNINLGKLIRTVRLSIRVTLDEGETLTLNTGLPKEQHNEIFWYFNGIRIAFFDGSVCLYDGEGERFRNRLENKSRSLYIKNITSEHAGLYEAWIIRSEGEGKNSNLSGDSKCNSSEIIRNKSDLFELIKTVRVTVRDSGRSAGVIVGICVAVGFSFLLVFAVALLRRHIYHPQKKPTVEGVMEVNQEALLHQVREAESKEIREDHSSIGV